MWLAEGRLQVLQRDSRGLKFALYVIFHPLDGFWELKCASQDLSPLPPHTGRCLSGHALSRMFPRFIFNGVDLSQIQPRSEIVSVLLPFGLWCGVNWALTTLMDGKGTIQDVYVATSYASCLWYSRSFIDSHQQLHNPGGGLAPLQGCHALRMGWTEYSSSSNGDDYSRCDFQKTALVCSYAGRDGFCHVPCCCSLTWLSRLSGLPTNS